MESTIVSDSTRKHVHWAANLHSEYRSTYKWHEYKGAAAAGAGVVRQPAPAPATSLPHSRDMFTGPTEPAMPRRKKYPGVAYKSNDLFDPSSAPAPSERLRSANATTLDRARSVERNDSRPGAGRRSKSEGPRQPRWTDTVEAKATATGTALGEVLATKEPPETVTEYRKEFAWPKDTTDAGAPRKSISMGTLKLGQGKKKIVLAEGATEMEPLMNHTEENVNEQHASKKYIEDYLWNGHKPGVPRKSTFRSALSAFISNGEDRSKDNRKRYKSEYKKKFRPFSQYVFEASKGTFTKCRGLKGKAGSLEREEGSTERMLPAPHATDAPAPAPALVPEEGESWYREALDLRKRAGEYKCRGWGTELAPDHITQLYDKQIELWYQVSRRSSLSALSLAATNHRALPSEKEAVEARTRSPKKVRSFRTAPHHSIHAKLSETRALERSSQKTSPQKVQRKKLQGHSFDETAAGNEGGKEYRSPRRRPRSADPKPAQQAVVNGHEPPKPTKPTGLPLNSRVKSTTKKSTAKTPSPTTATAKNATRRSRSVSKVGIKLEDEVPSLRSVSVAKDHMFDDTPVVKSPPEPTRVKSPEQMNMRSPDPVNWTVPLDTGKTFTVTQNVKNDDTVKRPSSEFKATSICEESEVASEATLGPEGVQGAEGAELVPVHHQLSPIRTLKKSDSPTGVHKRSDAYNNKTPTSPASLTPIDETKTLDITRPIINGSHSTHPSPSDDPKLSPDISISKPDNPIASKYTEITEMAKKPTEATRKATGVVDTSVVNDSGSAFTAAEVLERARNRFDMFWGKKEEDNV